MSLMEKNKGGVANWTPFSPMFLCPSVGSVAKRRGRPPGPAIYIDDDEDDAFFDESEPSEGSDEEWGSTRTRKKKTGKRGRPRKKPHDENVKSRTKGAVDDVLQMGSAEQDGSTPKVGASAGKKQAGKALKELGKLDLNVEFSNNEVEEPAPGLVREGASRPAQGDEDGGIEGIGFFEGLDEFLSSLPILNVVGDDKVKAA